MVSDHGHGSQPGKTTATHSRRTMLAAAAVAAGSASLRPVVSRAQDATPAADDMIHGAALEAALEKMDALAAARFTIGDDGVSTSLVLESMDGVGQGNLSRA